jgi:hypothetical protein
MELRKQWFPPQARPQARVSDRRAEILPIATPRVERQHDAHVRLWLDRQAAPIKAFIGDFAAPYGFTHEDIVGHAKPKPLVRCRHAAMVAVWTQFRPSLPEMAKLFNRDHTVVLHALRKLGVPPEYRPTIETHADKILEMVKAKALLREIAEAIGFSVGHVERFIHDKGWRQYREVPRTLASCSETVEKLYREGMSYNRMSKELNFDGSAISRFIKKQGWTRP